MLINKHYKSREGGERQVDMAFDRVAAQRPGDGKVSMSEFERLVHGSPWKSVREGPKTSWSMNLAQ